MLSSVSTAHFLQPNKVVAIASSTAHFLQPNKVVAIASDKGIQHVRQVFDPMHHPGVNAPWYGQDILARLNTPMPGGCSSVAKTESELVKIAKQLTVEFAGNDRSGMASRLLGAFLQKQTQVTIFQDSSLDLAASIHPNIQSFCRTAFTKHIHPALKAAGWKMRQIRVPTHLGVPAMNLGSLRQRTGDWGNGLAMMIDGVQHVYVVAENVAYNARKATCTWRLKFVLYDVFGLDDQDIQSYGDCWNLAVLAPGIWRARDCITAWWQLQHQFGYHPLITRTIFRKDFEGAIV